MHDAGTVSDRQGLRDGNSDSVDFGQRQCAFVQPFGQSFPFQKLHDKVIGAIL